MAQPPAYTRQADFSDYSANYPSLPHSGTNLDAEFDAVKVTTDAVRTNLAQIQADDGDLKNGSVGIDQLSADVEMGFRTVTDWLTATEYRVRDGVFESEKLYRCLVRHTSGTFATDLTAGNWVLVANYSGIVSDSVDAAASSASAASDSADAASASASTASSAAGTATVAAGAASDSADAAAASESNASDSEIAAAASAAAASAAASGYDWKQSMVVASITDVTVSAPGSAIDGVTMSTGDRVLLKDQSAGAENGIYEWNGAAVPMTRSGDADADAEVTFGLTAFVEQGTHANQQWTLTTNDPITVGSTALVFAQTASATGIAATTTSAGVVELLTQAELDAGSDTARAPTADILAKHLERELVIAASDETTELTTGDGKVVFRAPFAMTLTKIPRASLTTASTSGAVTIDIREAGTTILSTALTIDQDEKTSTTAATAAALSDVSIADDAEMHIDIDGAGTGAAGLKLTLFYRRT